MQKRKDVWIPERLLWIEVTEIGDEAFNHASSSEIETVHLPATLKALGKDVFKGCQKLQRICFDGTREDFAKIECATDLSRYELIFRSEDAMTEGTQSDKQEGEEQ